MTEKAKAQTKAEVKESKAAAEKAVKVQNTKATSKKYPLLAVIRVRGNVHNPAENEQTFKLLNLNNQNTLVLVEGTPTVMGMLQKLQSYITWGTVSDAVVKELATKRQPLKENVYRLSPPRKGWGRRGIKVPFTMKGALGNRREKIDDLIKRMM